jgi:hypothetical protein
LLEGHFQSFFVPLVEITGCWEALE